MEPLKIVKLKDGSTVTVNSFQACTYVELAKEYHAKFKNGSALEAGCYIASRLSTVDGKPLAYDDLLEMKLSESQKITSALDGRLEVISDDGDVTIGILKPSGRRVEIESPTLRDMIELEKSDDGMSATYGLISKCVKIEGEPIAILDVETMDGIEFASLTAHLRSIPT